MYCSSNTRKSCDQTAAGTTAVRTQTDTPDIATDAGPDMARIWHRYGPQLMSLELTAWGQLKIKPVDLKEC